MKFKLDENLSPETVNIFREHGFDALSVREQNLGGCDDDHLISVCFNEERVLVTLDLDFSDIRRYQPSILKGIIILKSSKQSRNYMNEIINKIIPLLKMEDISGKLVIVEEDKIRIR